MKKLKKTLVENKLRQYVRNEIRRIMEMDDDSEEGTTKEPTKEPKPQPKPQPKPKPQPEEEEGLSSDFEDTTSTYIGKLKSSTESVDHESLVDMLGMIIDSFVSSNEEKLNLLRAVKTKTVR